MTYHPLPEEDRNRLTARLREVAPTVPELTLQAFVAMVGDYVEGKIAQNELRDIIACKPELQDLLLALAQHQAVDSGSRQTVADFSGQIILGSQTVHDLVAGNQVNININIKNVNGVPEVSSESPPRVIYLSHLAKEPDAQALLKEIAESLRKAGYFVPPHEDRLTNERWQRELFEQIGRCQGAVILLSPSALKSELVAAECALLLSRPTSSQKYPYVLCKVYAAGVNDSKLACSPLANLPWDGVPPVYAPGLDGAAPSAAAVAAQVVDQINQGLPDIGRELQGPLTVLEYRIAGHLSTAPVWELQNAISSLDDKPRMALPEDDLRIKLAQALLRTDPDKAFETFDQLLNANVPRADIAQIFRLIATAWVDPRSATWVALVTRRPYRQRALGLNTSHVGTARLCVWRACHLRPDALPPLPDPGRTPNPRAAPHLGWDPVELTNSGGGLLPLSSAEALIREVSDGLRVAWTATASEVREGLIWFEKKGKPVLVMIQSETNSITPEALAALQEAFPTVTFLLLLGNQLPRPENWSLKPTPLICPALDDDKEIIDNYDWGNKLYALGQ